VKTALRSLIALLGLACSGQGQEFSYEATFREVWQAINEGYYDSTFGGVDWEALGERYRPRILEAASDSVFYVRLNEMLFDLGVSHIGVIPPDHPEWIGAPAVFADGGVGADIRILDGEIVITSVKRGSAAERAGLRPGIVVRAIDGMTLSAMAEAALAPPRPSIDARLIVNEHVQGKLFGPTGAAVRVEVDAADGVREVTLTREPRPGRTEFMEGIPPMFLEFESRWIDERIGYIRFNAFHSALLDRILAAIDEMYEADGLIFDLRGNPGGDFQVRRTLVEKLLQEQVLFWSYQSREGVRNIYATPDDRPYLGSVAVLVDRTSASSSEEFSGGLQAIGRAAVVGERTPGMVLVADVVQLENGATLVYPSAETRVSDGTVLEGRGVIPDIPVQLDAASLADGRDLQLEAAADYVRSATRRDGGTAP
jgi:carboxyl-terminal processing protease